MNGTMNTGRRSSKPEARSRQLAGDALIAPGESTMKNVKFTISITVPVPASAMLGGNVGTKELPKIDRERRYYLNALIRRGAVVVSQEEVATPAPAKTAK
jgi:hypothetical protein